MINRTQVITTATNGKQCLKLQLQILERSDSLFLLHYFFHDEYIKTIIWLYKYLLGISSRKITTKLVFYRLDVNQYKRYCKDPAPHKSFASKYARYYNCSYSKTFIN